MKCANRTRAFGRRNRRSSRSMSRGTRCHNNKLRLDAELLIGCSGACSRRQPPTRQSSRECDVCQSDRRYIARTLDFVESLEDRC